jgi:hypothetical protein
LAQQPHLEQGFASKSLSVAFLTVFVCFCSCAANLFGPESREIGGGYRLKRADNHNRFALIIPNESGGLIIDEIDWREPFIVARARRRDLT